MSTKTDTIRVVYKEGEDKPWHLDYEDVGVMKTARAALNYPSQKFETEEKAIEVAEMLRDIIHADAVEVPSENVVLDDVEPAPFFQNIPSDSEYEERNAEDITQVDENRLSSEDETALASLDTDYTGQPGPSQQQVEAERGIGGMDETTHTSLPRASVPAPPRL